MLFSSYPSPGVQSFNPPVARPICARHGGVSRRVGNATVDKRSCNPGHGREILQAPGASPKLDELLKEEQERERREELRRKIVEDAKRQFEQAVMGGCFPSEQVLAILADCESDIPVNLKEAVEELLYGRCSLRPMAFGDAVRLIQRRQRVEERAKARTASGNGHGFEPTGPVTQGEAYELLGVSPGCTKEELAAAYRRTISRWHPDKLETMAQELKDYATRRTARINEAYGRLKRRPAQAP